MRKTFCFYLILLGSILYANSQSIADNALGLRLGGNDGVSLEFSYQRAFTDVTRLEVDFGFRRGNSYDGYKLASIYQWLWEIDTNFNWYAGVGAGLSHYSSETYQPQNKSNYKYSKTYIFAAGDIGVEYDFDIPILISLDLRPELGSYYSGLGIDFAFGIRYQF